MLSDQDLKHYRDLGSRIGKDLGDKIAARLESHLSAQRSGPRQFKGGVPLAELSESEATQFVEVLPFVGEYVESAQTFAADGISLHDYVQSRIYDEHGCAMPGCIDTIPETLRSAMTKQSALFAAKFPVRQFG